MWSNLAANTIDAKDAHLYGPEAYSLVNLDVLNELSKKTKEQIRKYRKEHKVESSPIPPPQEFIELTYNPEKNLICFCGGNKFSVNAVICVDKLYKHLAELVNKHNKNPENTPVPRPKFISFLNAELNLLLEHLAPTDAESKAKLYVFNEVFLANLDKINNQCAVSRFEFDSVTSTCLPNSDLNLMLKASGDSIMNLKLLTYAMAQLDLFQCFDCKFMSKVPILKGVHKIKGSIVTISCNESLDSHTFIANRVDGMKFARPLIILLKFFLQSRNLGDTYTGGVGSYMLSLMVIFFLSTQTSARDSGPVLTLADVFIDYFHFWGYRINHNNVMITLKPTCTITQKKRKDRPFSFIDPIDSDFDHGSSAFNIRTVWMAYQCAFRALRASESDYNSAIGKKIGPLNASWIKSGTIIENIYDCRHPYFQHRKIVHSNKPAMDRFNIFSDKQNISVAEKEAVKSIQSIINGVYSLSDLTHVPYDVAALRYSQRL